MLLQKDRSERLARAADRLNIADTVTDELVATVVAAASDRLTAAGQGRRAAQLNDLVRAGAWTDAAFALLETERPQWKLRRLIYDEGEWHCAISRQRDLPDWLDQVIETRHADLSIAVLKGVVEAMRRKEDDVHASKPSPKSRDLQDLLCCDNFA